MPDDQPMEPDLHGWKPSPIGDWEGFSPLDVEPYQQVLTAIDIPPYVEPKDHTSDVPHWVAGVGPPMDDLIKLTLQQKVDLLNRNKIYLSMKQLSATEQSGLGAMAAYVVSNVGLNPATSFTPVVRFTKLELRTPQIGLDQNTAYSYNEFDSHLQQQLATATTVEVGIPKVFKVNTEFEYASSTATHSHDVTIHFSANNWVAGAEVVFDINDITLEPSFIEAVRKILNSNNPTENKAELLLAHLGDHGEFVPLVRINGDGYWTTDKETVISQAKLLHMQCVGGNSKLANGNPTHLGGEWIDSVSAHRLWRTIGFEERTLVPIVNFLPNDLRPKALELLRNYFLHRLHAQDTTSTGHKPTTKDKPFDETRLKGPDGTSLTRKLEKVSRGLSQIVVRSEGNVDGIKLSYRVYEGGYSSGPSEWQPIVWQTSVAAGPYYGNDRKSPERTIDLSPGEEIRKLEAWIDPNLDGGVMRSLAITTSKGTRYPDDEEGFFGANPKPGQSNPKPGVYQHRIIEAPRVRVLRGHYGAFVHSVWLTYLDLDAGKSRGFLLAMEPFLFPTGDYGPFYT